MKVKMKLDLQSIKNFALEHGEKIAFAVVGVVFLMFVYSALKREALEADKQPDRLQAKAREVQAHVTQSTFDATRDDLALVDYVDRAKRDRIELGGFPVSTPLNQRIFDAKAKRDNPEVFPVDELRADAGFGVFALQDGAGGGDAKERAAGGGRGGDVGFTPGINSKTVGRAYAVITGLVPAQKQTQEYSRLFDNALGADMGQNRPQYVRLVVQRADVDPTQPNKVEWKDLPPVDEFTTRFEGNMADRFSSKYLQAGLVDPLGPLVRRAWGESVTHPKVAAAAAQAGDNVADNRAAERPKVGGAKVDDLLRQAGARGAPRAAAAAMPDSDVEYRLCRYFDFSVEPKKRYRYRAKAILHNPNRNVPLQFLVKPDTATVETLETEWSNSTGMVAVPDRYGVLAVSATKNTNRDEPSVTLLATAIDETEGIEAGTEVDVYRASVVDLTAPVVEAIDPRDGAIRELHDVKFDTGIVVVDIHGGRQLSKRFGSSVTGPVEVLVMDGQGNLRVRSELVDHAAVHFLAPMKEEDTPAKKKAGEDDIPSKADIDALLKKPRSPRGK